MPYDSASKLDALQTLRAAVRFLWVFLILSCTGWSAEVQPASNALPRAASVAATNGLASFRVRPGFRLELVATEPAVISPVAMAFDENNRLFVVERRDNPGASGAEAHAGRVRLLEDTEGDGEFHMSTVYADNLPWASAVACYNGGVFVAASPDIVFLKDTKTNGVANQRKAIFTGFTGTNAFDALALPNSFNWGMDNCIHAASAGIDASVPESSAAGAPLLSLTSADFSFDPRALTLHAEAGPAQSGVSFDDWGRRFSCDFVHPLRSPRYEARYLARNPYFPPPPLLQEVAGPTTPIFRLGLTASRPPARERPRGTNEPARALAQGANVLAPTWFTNARGCVIYRGNAFASNYLGNAFIADASAHVIHRIVLGEAGLDVTAARAPDEKSTEFVVSSDPDFHPTQIINGPDGALYVADKQDGQSRGRIYRIVPANFKRPKPARFAKATTYGLVATLSNPNGWHRDTAARLLYERRDVAAVPLLAETLIAARRPIARLQVLHALDGLGALTPRLVQAGLQDQDEHVREHAVRLAEKLIKGGAAPAGLWDQLRQTANDSSIRVRCQVALTLGQLPGPANAQALAGIFLQTPDNPWVQAAILSSLADGAGDLFLALVNDSRIRGSSAGWTFLRQLATMIGVQNRPEAAAQVLGFIDRTRLDPQPAFAMLYALGDGLQRGGSSLALMDPQNRMQRLYAEASDAVMNYSAYESIRVEALRLMRLAPFTFATCNDLLLMPLGTIQSEPVQSGAIAALGCFDDERVAPALIQRWRVLTPRLRTDAVAALLARTRRIEAVLTALESGRIERADVSPIQVNFLRTHRNPAVRQRAAQLFGPGPRQRPDAVQRFKATLSLRGAAERGRETYQARCAACHQSRGSSPEIGPDLGAARIYGKQRILAAILEPNVEVRRDYLTYVLETVEGENLIGLLRGDNPATVCLQQVQGRSVVMPRANIRDLQEQPWSLMPEGLEEGLTPQGMADLLEYIVTAAPSASP